MATRTVGVKKGKGLIRATTRGGSRSGKAAPGSTPTPAGALILCERCGARWSRRTWRGDRPLTAAQLARARWKICPACQQITDERAFGRVLLRGAYVRQHEGDIRKRIANVAERARFTQPERRLVSIEAGRDGLEVLTTSQKLAHRIVHELKKVFRGRAAFQWSDSDRSLYATWTRER